MKLEMHAHTNEVSFCAHISAKDTVNLYKDSGYDGIVITNHYSRYFIDMMHDRSFDHLMDFYLNGFKLAQESMAIVRICTSTGIYSVLSAKNTGTRTTRCKLR